MKVFEQNSARIATAKRIKMEQIQAYLCEKFHLPEDQVAEMLPKFMETLVSHMEKLHSATLSGDLERIGRAGHTMKGALLNLGLNDCADIAFDIERFGKEHDSSVDYAILVNELRAKLGELLAEDE